jgi:hypothetical protein
MASLHSSMPTVFSHAVSRSNELLSCAKTAVKIAQRKHASSGAPTDTPDTPDTYNWWTVKLTDLQLYDGSNQEPHVSHEVLEDGLSLLRTMEGELKHLEGLVRRRGHTNDPTEEISLSVKSHGLDQDHDPSVSTRTRTTALANAAAMVSVRGATARYSLEGNIKSPRKSIGGTSATTQALSSVVQYDQYHYQRTIR